MSRWLRLSSKLRLPNNPAMVRAFASRGGGHSDTIIPGMPNQYGSLGESPILSRGAESTAWQASDNTDVQRVTQKALIYELIHEQTRTIESVVPWFLENMPAVYFQQVPERYRIDHIKAIAAIKDANMDLYLNLQSKTEDGRTVLTFIRPGTTPGTLLHMVEELPWKYNIDQPLTRLHVFSTVDETMSLNMFVYGQKPLGDEDWDGDMETQVLPILDFAEKVQNGAVNDHYLKASPLLEKESLMDYMSTCRRSYIQIGMMDPTRFLTQRLLFGEVSGTEGVAVNISLATDQTPEMHLPASGPLYWVEMAVSNSIPQVALESLCQLLYHHKFDVQRARLDVVPDGDNGSVTILRTLITPTSQLSADSTTDWDNLQQELKRAKWLDPETLDLVFGKYPWLGIARGEVLTAMSALMHPVLTKTSAFAYSKANISEVVGNNIGYAASIADLFLDRFNPTNPLSDAEYVDRRQEIEKVIDSEVEDHVATTILYKMLDVIEACLKTNAYMPDRYALGMRLDPSIMHGPGDESDLPFGVLFVHGRRFNGFHVRFRDISRGGMRLVTPANTELYALESARHYDECYGLAFAQQLKNKDIPEGGSKAVNLINTTGLASAGKDFVMRKSVKAFTDSILDLIVKTEETDTYIVNRLGRPEVLYLGPDEQVIPSDIEWIVKRAAERGYNTPGAFMSSKPKAGINHKEFGVTSEGVNVYLDTALRHVLGIDPKYDSFTVKMTGGPDGDVAGNELKILFREYGENVKIVGIADHSGCAEDADGLDHDELTRLVDSGLCISNFTKSKLGPNGILHLVDTPEGMKARNTMHNRLEADAFVPCGGRPSTIDISNYKHFLKADGTPSAPLIVEGANLFVTAEARQALFEDAGVFIIKDSSANKGGVITSSYEICAAMLLSEGEFVQHKSAIVAEVLEKLRGLAKLEAELMFREFEIHGGSLPQTSQVISNCINAATDALTDALDLLAEEDRDALLPLFKFHLPRTLADLAFDKVNDRVPAQYIKNAISSSLAAKMVYKEGTKFIESLPKNKLAEIALKYMEKEKEVAELMLSLEDSTMAESDKEAIMKLLDAGGARTALGL